MKQNGDLTCVLPEFCAEIVCTPLRLPSDADPTCLHVGEAYAGDAEHPFLRCVWFTPETADTVMGEPSGTHLQTTRELHALWRANGSPLTRVDATQPAAGVYSELGTGIMPGGGRCSMLVGGRRTNVPYSREAILSKTFEPLLSKYMSSISTILHEAIGSKACASHEIPNNCPMYIARAYQYPTLMPKTPQTMSHQVVIRGPKTLEDPDAFRSCSDLHVDSWDGGGQLGTCTVHTCTWDRTRPRPTHEVEKRNLALRGIACFPYVHGGRGVHVHSMVPGWQCILLIRTSNSLHGSVVPCAIDSETGRATPLSIEGLALPELEMMRVVTYPLKRVETLLHRLGEDPSKAEELERVSDSVMRERMRALKADRSETL